VVGADEPCDFESAAAVRHRDISKYNIDVVTRREIRAAPGFQLVIIPVADNMKIA
jgi:hypothetical protein